MARPKKYAQEAISLDAAADDVAAVDKAAEEEIKANTSHPGNRGRTRKEIAATKTPAKNRVTTSAPVKVDTSAKGILQLAKEPIIMPSPSEARAISNSAEAVLSDRQRLAIDMLSNLVERHTVADVAAKLGITTQAVYDWLNQVPFLTAFELALREKFIPMGKAKAMLVFADAMDAKAPSTRMLEIIAKSLGFYSDGSEINLAVEVNSTEQNLHLERNEEI